MYARYVISGIYEVDSLLAEGKHPSDGRKETCLLYTVPVHTIHKALASTINTAVVNSAAAVVSSL